MQKNSSNKFTKLLIVGELLLVSYLLYTLTVSVYKSYQIDLIITEFEKENSRIEEDNRKKMEDFEYFTSDNYIEKIAKQNMGLINPGEEVLVIPSTSGSLSDNPNVEFGEGDEDELNNFEKWYLFFFDK